MNLRLAGEQLPPELLELVLRQASSTDEAARALAAAESQWRTFAPLAAAGSMNATDAAENAAYFARQPR